MKQARESFDWLKPDKEEVQDQYFWNRYYCSQEEESKTLEMPMNFTQTQSGANKGQVNSYLRQTESNVPRIIERRRGIQRRNSVRIDLSQVQDSSSDNEPLVVRYAA